MKRNILVFGAISSLVVTALLVITMLLYSRNPDFDGGMVLGFGGMIIAFSMIFAAVKNYRDNYNNGVISFGQAFKMGLAITLIASTVYVGVWLIEYNFFFLDFMERFAERALIQAKEKGVSNAEYAQQAEQMAVYVERYKNPIWVILLTYMEIFPVGLLFTLACALILKRKKLAQQPQTATI